ncbi:hypothetical protein PIB30_009978 [Stylosanthes scabra]|uniref:Aminotransferase-like plant mobile domain-containing protein n=1 Tax=Stylosanthes scabra TaxID=79078 RepID=A0ABU6U670_9FABA|nr:hypothetical protein [Stylosanthes scabra]
MAGETLLGLVSGMFGVMHPPEATDPCRMTFSSLTSTFWMVSENASEVQVRGHAHAYIMLLVSTQLFGDKTAARVPVRWTPFVDQIDDLGQYSWGSSRQAWLYRNLCRFSWPVASRWARYLPTSDEKDPRVLQYRTMLDRMTHCDV